MSEDTAKILVAAGKSHVIRKREDTITAKGKGEMVTYWLALGADRDDEPEDDTESMSGQTTSSFGNLTVAAGDDAKSEASASSKGSKKNGDFVRKAPAVSMSGLARMKRGQMGVSGRLDKMDRLIEWNVDVLTKLLKQIVARRGKDKTFQEREEVQLHRPEGQPPLEEVVEIITLPKFDADAAKHQEDPKSIDLGKAVTAQLRIYVKQIAAMYR